jgi:multidrug efflux pump subunit AcrA (membrane-fusion protein)
MRYLLLLPVIAIALTQSCAAQIIEIESAVVKLLDEAELATQEAGLLTQLLVSEGERVKKGQLLATIDSRQAELAEATAKIELALAQAEAENDVAVRFAEKAHQVAESELARSRESIARFARSVSQSQIDVETLTVDKLVLEIEQARHDRAIKALGAKAKEMELRAAQLERLRRQVLAPIDATVVEVRHSVGEWIEPGVVLVRLVSTDRVKVEGFITADEATTIGQGDPAAVVRSKSESPLNGRVVFVSPEIDPINKQVRVWAEIENPNGLLRPGESVVLQIDSDD